MNKRTIRDVRQVLDQNTQRRSIQELARAGKQTVRAISEEKLLTILEAVVDEAIASEAGDLAKRDRGRIVKAAREKLGKVMKTQGDLETKIHRQSETIEAGNTRIEALTAERDALQALVEQSKQAEQAAGARAEKSAAERDQARRQTQQAEQAREQQRLGASENLRVSDETIAKLEQELTAARSERSRTEDRAARLKDEAAQLSGHLVAATSAAETTSGTHRREIDARTEKIAVLNSEGAELRARLEERTSALAAAREELGRLTAEMQGSQERSRELIASSETSRQRDAEQAQAAINTLQGELAKMQTTLGALANRTGPDASTVEAIVTRLSKQEQATAQELERKFDATLGRALDEVERSLRRVSAKPVDHPIEATDALIGKIFDEDTAATSNYDQLGVEVRRSPRRIGGSVEQLKALRQRSGAPRKTDKTPHPHDNAEEAGSA